jgi:hypothetical protein
MWNLSKHIYRFTPAFVEENKNVHTVDEVSCLYICYFRFEGWLTEAENLVGRSPQHHPVLLQTPA